MHTAFTRTEHRPWPLPDKSWQWRQSWVELLFLHWPIPASILQPLVPRGLKVQEFEGVSYLGIVPFRMEGVMHRPLPDVPGVSAFPELNVRIYVEAEGKTGVWFLSLDATKALAVWAARTFFFLPYYRADISMVSEGAGVSYTSRRRHADASFSARYRPEGPVYESKPGTLESWLTERYCLYALRPDGVLLRNEVHHVPWPLQRAHVEIEDNNLLSDFGIALPSTAPIAHFSPRVDVVLWDAVPVQCGSAWSALPTRASNTR